jgi:deoxyribonuclease-2
VSCQGESKNLNNYCLSPNNTKVDWSVIFLFPETSYKDGKLAYGYFDNNSKEMQYYYYDENSFPSIKVVIEYDQIDTNYFFWNDDTTADGQNKTSSSSKAHSKGGLIFDNSSGVFLSHSLPRFPRRNIKNKIVESLPSNAGIYGQTFICISVDKENALKVVETLNIIDPPLVLNVDIDKTQKTPNEQVQKLIKNKFDPKLPQSKVSEVVSRAGTEFQIFSKGRNEENLPWDSLIPNHYSDGIYVQTWTKPLMVPTTCEGHQIINVTNLKFGKYEYTKDQEHSKWGVGIKKDICCFGDLNRTFSQMKRGGSIICMNNPVLAVIMRNAIVGKDECSKKNVFLEYL